MKHDCTNEFDLDEIYRKLTSSSKQEPTIKASEFFPGNVFALFQQRLASVTAESMRQVARR